MKTGAGTRGCIHRPGSNRQWAISHIQMRQELKAHKKGHQNTFLTIFTRFQLFLCVYTRYCLLSIVSEPPAHIPECQHMFSSLTAHFQLVFNYFQLFLAVFFFFKKYFIRFHLFSIDFIHFSIVFICFRLFLPKFKCYCSFSPNFLVYFFSIIFIYFSLY